MGYTETLGITAEIQAERARQDIKWGEQNHRSGTGEQVPFLPGRLVPHPAGSHVLTTMGTLAYLSREACQAANEEGGDTYAKIMLEEVFEAMAEDDEQRVRAELIQCAAVAVAWVEAIDRRAGA